MRHAAEYLLFRTAVCVLDAVPMRVAAGLCRWLAWVVQYVLPRRWTRYQVSRENVRRAFGDSLSDAQASRLVYEMWNHLFRMICEIAQAPRKIHLSTYRDIIEFGSHRPTVEAICSGRQVILLGGHFGNWELGMSVLGIWKVPTGIVARQLDNPYLHHWFREYREQTGHRMVLKRGEFDELLTLMERGGNAALLGDQDAGPRGLFVDFFGTPASTFKSLALLAMTYDALICVGSYSRLPDDFANHPWSRFVTNTHAVLDPRDYQQSNAAFAMTQDYAHALEAAIRVSPEQYFWVHRRWKSEPRQKRKAA